MKRYQVGVAAVVLGCGLPLSSCGDLNEPLAGGGGMLMSPALPPSGMGTRLGNRHFHAVRVGAATAEQRRIAETRAQAALKSSRVQTRVKQQKVRYVAVPVKRATSQPASGGTTVMKVNADTGVPTGDVYEAKDQGGARDGDTIRLGGDPTLYFATAGDKV